MFNQENLIITQDDFQTISSLVKTSQNEATELLEAELDRATIVANEDLPQDVVTMNSMVVYKDLETEKVTKATLVYPQDVKIEENKISILSPVGSALIGLRVGQLIEWPMPNNKSKRLLVMEVSR